MAVYDKLEKLIEKYEEYIRQYEAQKELDEYDQGQYNNLLSAVASLKDIANNNLEAHIPTEIVYEMQALKENLKYISVENVDAALKNLTQTEKDTLLRLYVYGERKD